MTTRDSLKQNLLAALAVGQTLRSTALATHLYPIIDAMLLQGESGGWVVSATPPAGPTEGEGWWDSSEDCLKVWTGLVWFRRTPVVASAAPSNPITGEQWYDTGDLAMRTWNGSEWVGAGGGEGTPGAPGAAGSYERAIFHQSANAPPAPTEPSTVAAAGDDPTAPVGWAATPQAGDTPIWVSYQRRATGSTAITYTSPRRWDGADGTAGAAGAAGSYERTIFHQSANAPAAPTAPASVASPGTDPTLPVGWAATPQAGNTAIWASIQRRATGSTTITYTSPRRWDGTDAAGGAVSFGSGSGQVATWAEGDSAEKIPLDDLGTERRASIDVRIIFQNPGSSNPTAADFATLSGQSGQFVDFPDGTGQRIIDLFVGTRTLAAIQDIEINGISIFGTNTIFGSRRLGTFITVNGVEGMFWRSIVVNYNDYQHLRLYVRLTQETLPDLIVDEIHTQVDHPAIEGSTQRWPTSKIPESTVIGLSLDSDGITVQQAAGSNIELGWPSNLTQQGGGTSGWAGMFRGRPGNLVNGETISTDADGFDGSWYRYQGGSAGTVTFANPTDTSTEYRVLVHNSVTHLLTLELAGVTNPVLAKDDLVVLLWDTLNTRWEVIPMSGELNQMVSGGGSTSPETRIGHVDSVSVANSALREVALDEDIATGHDYQIAITDDSTGNTALSPRFSGEWFRGKTAAASVPTTVNNSIGSILTLRENNTDPSMGPVARWVFIKGRTNRELYVSSTNSSDLGPLTIEVFKYARSAMGEKGDKGDPGDPGANGEVARTELRALRDAARVLPYSANATLLNNHPTVDNRERINDADLSTFATFNGGTKRAVTVDWGRSVRRPRIHVWANGVSQFSFRGVNANGHDSGHLLNVTTANGKTVWDAGENDLRGMFLVQISNAPSVNIFLIYVEDTRLTDVSYDPDTRQLLGLHAVLPEATDSAAGLQSAVDKAKLDTYPANYSTITALIDAITSAPSGDESLLDLVASTYPRDIGFTLGTRIPGGSDPGYNAGTHSLNAAGSFAEAGIPSDIVTIYRVTESETVQGVQLQNRLLVGVDEEGGSRRYEGEAIRWGGQLVTLTYLQRSLNNFNEYYSDVVTTLSTAGQTVAFNVEDVQAEARDAIPYRRWIWHHSVATTQEHISNGTFTADTASQVIAPTQHAVAEYAIPKTSIRTTVRALGSASDEALASERGVRLAIDAIAETLGGLSETTIFSGDTRVTQNAAPATVVITTTQDIVDYDELVFTGRGEAGQSDTQYAATPEPVSEWRLLVSNLPTTQAARVSPFTGRLADRSSLGVWRSGTRQLSFLMDRDGTNNTETHVAPRNIVKIVGLDYSAGSQGVGGLGGGTSNSGEELLYLKSATATPLNTNAPSGLGYTGTGYTNLGDWVTVAPTPEAGFNILVSLATRVFTNGQWAVAAGNPGLWYQGVDQQLPERFINFDGSYTFVQSTDNKYREIWIPADNRYSNPIQIVGRASVDLLLLAQQDLPVSGTATAGPTITTTRTQLRDYPKLGVNVQLRIGNVILRQKYFEISSQDIVPLSIANQNNTRAQRMLAISVNSPFAAGPNWIDVAIIDGNTTAQRSPAGYARRYLANFVRANNDPDGDSAAVFSFLVVAEHDAGTFDSGVRIQLFGVQ